MEVRTLVATTQATARESQYITYCVHLKSYRSRYIHYQSVMQSLGGAMGRASD